MPEVAMSRERTMNVDLSQGDLDELSIGDEVEVRVRGEVKSLSAGRPPEGDFDGFPPDMTVKVTSTRVRKREENEFSRLARDDDED